jgi:serine protease AprX
VRLSRAVAPAMAALAVAALALPAPASASTGLAGANSGPISTAVLTAAGDRSVVVMAAPGAGAAVEAAADGLGIRVTRRLGIIHGFAARGSAAAIARLAGLADVVSVSADRAMTAMSVVPALGYDPADSGSLSSVSQIVGAQAAWAAGYTGAGVDVAVIDTGVTPVAGLSTTGKVITGPDLSFDAVGASTPGLDAFGHGTFMAGLIAGKDTGATASATGCTTCLNSSGYSDTTKFVGVAPNAGSSTSRSVPRTARPTCRR